MRRSRGRKPPRMPLWVTVVPWVSHAYELTGDFPQRTLSLPSAPTATLHGVVIEREENGVVIEREEN